MTAGRRGNASTGLITPYRRCASRRPPEEPGHPGKCKRSRPEHRARARREVEGVPRRRSATSSAASAHRLPIRSSWTSSTPRQTAALGALRPRIAQAAQDGLGGVVTLWRELLDGPQQVCVNAMNADHHHIKDLALADAGSGASPGHGRDAVLAGLLSASRASGRWMGCACRPACTSPPRRQLRARAAGGGAQLRLCASNPLSTQDDVAAALAAKHGVPTSRSAARTPPPITATSTRRWRTARARSSRSTTADW